MVFRMCCFLKVVIYTGAPHGSELLYLFGPTVFRQEIGVGFSRQDEAVSDLMKRAWFEFATGGYNFELYLNITNFN